MSDWWLLHYLQSEKTRKPKTKKEKARILAKIHYQLLLLTLIRHPELAKNLPKKFWKLLSKAEKEIYG